MLKSCKDYLAAASLTSALFFAPAAGAANLESAHSLPTVVAISAAHDAHQNLATGDISGALKALEKSATNMERVTAEDPSSAFLPLGTSAEREDISRLAVPARTLQPKLRAAKQDVKAGKTADARAKLETVLSPLGMT